MGAWDGMHLSNTYALLNSESKLALKSFSKSGWGGILFEADIDRFQELKKLYAKNHLVYCIQSLVTLDGTESLSSQLEKHQVRRDFDLLSIDIDGCDYYIWNEVRSLY